MGFNVVLHEPEIPNNTGNIGRLCLASNSTLHLIKPYGFEITDQKLRRAGLDYWQYLNYKEYNSFDDFMTECKPQQMAMFSSHAKKSYLNLEFKDDIYLIFGKESVGLPNEIISTNPSNLFQIPLYSQHIRSLNIANAVSIVLYEGLRQLKL